MDVRRPAVRTALGVGAAMVAVLGGCGSGGGGAGDSSSGGSGISYAFVPPVVNSVRTYAETVIDNSNNSIDIGFSQTVTAVATDGTITEIEASTTGASDSVNGTNYEIPTQTQTYDNEGQETSYVFTNNQGNPETCTYAPHGDGPDYPLQVGQTWTLSFTLTCGSAAPVSYTQTGTVADVESVTVPAGTFTALKLTSTVTWTNAAGTTRTQSITNWRDVASSRSVKQDVSIAVSGTLPSTGYAVSRSIVLQTSS